ncbi:uncharacterized protein LOC143152089 [Ptiloglossa arizonensis]|uniref:uncharacterized protein LOC143152089 n=1 Tax=Ptiloglossa arizonensis TaxID=3350558 RepID=UPI003FA0E118
MQRIRIFIPTVKSNESNVSIDSMHLSRSPAEDGEQFRYGIADAYRVAATSRRFGELLRCQSLEIFLIRWRALGIVADAIVRASHNEETWRNNRWREARDCCEGKLFRGFATVSTEYVARVYAETEFHRQPPESRHLEHVTYACTATTP